MKEHVTHRVSTTALREEIITFAAKLTVSFHTKNHVIIKILCPQHTSRASEKLQQQAYTEISLFCLCDIIKAVKIQKISLGYYIDFFILQWQ